jgi:hypothetical protein
MLVEMLVPQSLPAATNRPYPRRVISSHQARAMRWMPQPVAVGLPLNAYPGSDGTTTWNAPSAASSDSARSNSRNEPGQPCVRITGVAPGFGERTCRKWIDSPSMSVRNCGIALSRRSVARQS